MKTNEFKKAVEALGFDLGHSFDGTTIDMFMVYDEDSNHVGSVYTKQKISESVAECRNGGHNA